MLKKSLMKALEYYKKWLDIVKIGYLTLLAELLKVLRE